jgi:TonB-linked SusC/RagA family outer membrane protein
MRKTLLCFLSMLCALYSFSQTRTVTGSVTQSDDGAPLAGVTVTVKGTNDATSTGPDGSFSISVSGANPVLVFSSVGFLTKEVTVGSGPVNVQLSKGSSSMEEVVVTGYTQQARRKLTGSVARVVGDEIKLQPVGSFDKALQGKVPGLLSQSQTGQPGAAAQVVIRGKGSLQGTIAPLFIIDGVQVTAADFSSLNPGDIETYSVLKDASAVAIYGSRGANGVIVITTKRGASGKTQVNYDFQYGYSELPDNKLRLMTSAEKLQYEFYDRPFYGDNPFQWTPAEVDSLGKIVSDIEPSLFRKGTTQQHQVSVSGGNDKTRFYLSGSIFDQEGIVKTTGLKRYTGRANIDHTTGNFKIGLNTTLGYSKFAGTRENDTYVGSPLNAIRWFNPYLSLYDADGNYQDDFLQSQPNPLRELLDNYSSSEQLKGVGSAYIEWNIPFVKGLKAKTIWGGDFTEDEAFNYLDRTTNQGSQATGGNGSVQRAWSKRFRYVGTTSLSYQKSFGDHDLSVAVFHEVIESRFENFGFTGYGLTGPFKNEAGITPGTPTNGYIPNVNGDKIQSSLLSYFIDGNYGYKGKYYLNFSARRDGSSRLTEDKKWANFGAVGASWILSDENFLQGATGWLDMLKYKISYGSAGSQGVGEFSSRALLSPTTYNGRTGLLLTNLETPITWERKLIFNTGFDFAFLKNRVTGSVEYYRSTTNNLFSQKQLSRTGGYSTILQNLGELRNEGIEVMLSGDVIRMKDFTWSVSANFTYNKNKLLSLGEDTMQIDGFNINKVGSSINSLYLIRFAGVDPTDGRSQYYDKDGKITKTYTPDNRVILGAIDPPYFGGFSTTLNYKGIGLDVLFSYAFGNKVYNNDRVQVENPGYWFSQLSAAMLTEWRNPGDVTNIPSPFFTFRNATSRFVEKGDYLRLRNVTLSYELPASIMQKARLRSLRVFAQGQNLKVWHNFQGYDPEIINGALGGGQYPQLKTVTFGLNLGL